MEYILTPWRKPAPFHADEDALSLVVRMAAYGGMPLEEFVSTYLNASAGWLIYLPFKMAVIRRLAAMASVNLEHLAANACAGTIEAPVFDSGRPRHFRGQTLPLDWISLHKRVAPGMLRLDGDDPYIRLAWRFAALPCDPTTGEMLLSRCPSCAGRLGWETTKVGICHRCRFDVRTCAPTFADTQVLADVRAIAGALGLIDEIEAGPMKLPEPLGDLNLEQQLSMLQWCARLGGLLEGTALTGGVATAYAGIKIARAWPKPLREAADLLIRQLDEYQRNPLEALTEMLKDVKPPELEASMIEQAADAISDAMFAIRHSSDAWKSRPRPQYLDLATFRISDRVTKSIW